MRHLVLLMAFAFLYSCSDKQEVPDVPVNFHASLSDPRLSRLNSPGGAATITGYGVAGLIIYRRTDNAYVAYDRCSTVNPDKKCAVNVDDPSLTATDPCSGARFSLYDGAAVKAPATKPLRQYPVSVTQFEISVVN